MPLPAGTTLPPLGYTVGLLLAVILVTGALYHRKAVFSERILLSLTPWMVAGASIYVLYQIDVLPPAVTPVCSSPAVYLSTYVLAGIVWLLTLDHNGTAKILAVIGCGLSLLPITIAIAYASQWESLAPGWPLIGLMLSVILSWLTWRGFASLRPNIVDTLGPLGFLAVFGHILDGVTTTIGIDVLSFVELTPLSKLIMDLAGMLPIASVIGVGWLFVVVKLLVSLFVVWLVADLRREDPVHATLLLGVIIAVGLGPGVHNLLLFSVTGPAGI
jgi:uncharacterized membrane protein